MKTVLNKLYNGLTTFILKTKLFFQPLIMSYTLLLSFLPCMSFRATTRNLRGKWCAGLTILSIVEGLRQESIILKYKIPVFTGMTGMRASLLHLSIISLLIFTTGMTNNKSVYADEIYKKLESGEIAEIEFLVNTTLTSSPDNIDYLNLSSDIEFYKGNYPAAYNKMQQLCVINPTNSEFEKKMVYYGKITKLAEQFTEYTTTHFRLRLSPKDDVLKYYALDSLEQIYQNIGKVFNYYPKEKIVVEVIPTKDEFLLASTLSEKDVENSGAIAICKFNRLMMCSPRNTLFGFRWLDTFAHEYTHMIINRLSKYNCPLWLHEGIARYSDTLWRSEKSLYFLDSYEDKLAKAVKTNNLISFARMSPSLVKLTNQDEVGLAFAQVANAVDYMLTKHGSDVIEKLLSASEKEGMDIAFKKVLGLTQEQFEQTWRSNLSTATLTEHPGVVSEKITFTDNEVEQYVGADTQGHIRLGDKFLFRNMPIPAEQQYLAALKQEPNNPVILNKLAKSELKLVKFDDAEKHLLYSIEINPNHDGSYITLANLYFLQHKWNDAIKMYSEAIAINPFNPMVHKRYGFSISQTGGNVLALQEWEVTSVLDPDDLETQGWINQFKENLETKIIPSSSYIVEQKLLQSYNFIINQQYDEAISLCKEILNLEPNNITALERLGSAYFMKKQFDEAKAVWLKVMELEPENKVVPKFLEQMNKTD